MKHKFTKDALKEIYTAYSTKGSKTNEEIGEELRKKLGVDYNESAFRKTYQYWRNIGDADVITCMKMLTFIPMDEIREYEKLEGSEINKAKEILAFEVTKLIHGEEEAAKAQEAARALFANKADSANMPTTALTDDDFTDGEITVIDAMLKAGIVPSKGEARRAIDQGGVAVNDEKVTSISQKITKAQLEEAPVIIKKGKKVFHKITL